MKYEHLFYFKVKEGKPYICIDRIFEGGRRDFMTHHELPHTEGDEEGFDLMEKLASWLGGSMLIDCPEFREHIGINE